MSYSNSTNNPAYGHWNRLLNGTVYLCDFCTLRLLQICPESNLFSLESSRRRSIFGSHEFNRKTRRLASPYHFCLYLKPVKFLPVFRFTQFFVVLLCSFSCLQLINIYVNFPFRISIFWKSHSYFGPFLLKQRTNKKMFHFFPSPNLAAGGKLPMAGCSCLAGIAHTPDTPCLRRRENRFIRVLQTRRQFVYVLFKLTSVFYFGFRVCRKWWKNYYLLNDYSSIEVFLILWWMLKKTL